MLTFYLASSGICMISLGIALKKIADRLKKDGYSNIQIDNSLHGYFKTVTVSFIPVFNIICPIIFVTNFDEIYESVKKNLVKKGIERTGQEDLEKYCGLKVKDEEIENNEKQEVDVTEFENIDAQKYANNLRNSLDKEYAKLSEEERLIYLKRELEVLIRLREKLNNIEEEQVIENNDSKKVKKIEENQKHHN